MHFSEYIPIVKVMHDYNLKNSKVLFKDNWVWGIGEKQAGGFCSDHPGMKGTWIETEQAQSLTFPDDPTPKCISILLPTASSQTSYHLLGPDSHSGPLTGPAASMLVLYNLFPTWQPEWPFNNVSCIMSLLCLKSFNGFPLTAFEIKSNLLTIAHLIWSFLLVWLHFQLHCHILSTPWHLVLLSVS